MVTGIGNDLVAKFIGFAVCHAAFDSAPAIQIVKQSG